MEVLYKFDIFLFLLINKSLANPVFDFIFIHITNGTFWIVPGVAAAAFFAAREKKKGVLILLAALLTVAFTDPVCCRVLKPWFHRLRPCHPAVLVEGGRFLLQHKTSFSFPSAHAMNIFAQAMLFGYFYRKAAVWSFLLAGLVGFSRVYVGVHYPADVAAGAWFGVISTWLLIGLAKGAFALYYYGKKKYGSA